MRHVGLHDRNDLPSAGLSPAQLQSCNAEEACRLAIDDEGWGDAAEDIDSSGETYVTRIWEGHDAIRSGEEVAIPDAYGETVQRKAAMLDELAAILREPARPMGLSLHEFETWLPRALAALAKVDAITTPVTPER